MKYLITLLSVFIMMAAFTSGAEAQIFKKLKKKAQKKMEQKTEQKIDAEMEKAANRMVDDSWDAVFGSAAVDKDGNKLPFAMNSNATTEEVYRFDIITTMEIKSEQSDGKSQPPMYMDMHFNEDAEYTGTKFRGAEMDKAGSDLFLIYDFKNAAMVMLMSSEDGKFSFAYDWQQALEQGRQMAEEYEGQEQAEEEVNWEEVDEWNGYTKIGSRSIAGYNCDGYRTENREGAGMVEVWVTRDDAFGMANMFKANANAKQLKGKIPSDYPYGMMVEMTSVNSNGDKTTMKITDVKKNANVSYVMADYPNMGMKEK